MYSTFLGHTFSTSIGILGLLCLAFCLTGCDQVSKSAEPIVDPSPSGSATSQPLQSDQGSPAEGLSALIKAEQVAALLNSKTDDAGKIKLLEPGKKVAEFDQGHLPGAQFVHWIDDMTDPDQVAQYNNPSAKHFAEVMSRLGIENDDRIIIYDRLASRLSTRLFWTLKYFGHQRVHVLDGGIGAWQAQFELSKESSEVDRSDYQIAAVNNSIFAQMDYVEKQQRDPNTRLIDGRPAKQFSGEEPGTIFHTNETHPRKGHIPGAKSVFWQDNFNKDGTFKSIDQLRAIYRDQDILPRNKVITYCNEGLHAAPPWFILTQLLDYKDVRLYDSSMAEWARSENAMGTTTTSGDKE